MTVENAKTIGAKQGLISVIVGIIIAHLIMTFMISSDNGFIDGFLWITRVDYWYHILIGCLIMILCGYFYGGIAGKLILLKKRNYIVVGFLTGMAVLLTTGFLGGMTGFIQEGIDNIGTNDNPFYDYLFKPLYWVTLFGLVPALIVGTIFGNQIKRKGKKSAEKHSSQQRV